MNTEGRLIYKTKGYQKGTCAGRPVQVLPEGITYTLLSEMTSCSLTYLQTRQCWLEDCSLLTRAQGFDIHLYRDDIRHLFLKMNALWHIAAGHSLRTPGRNHIFLTRWNDIRLSYLPTATTMLAWAMLKVFQIVQNLAAGMIQCSQFGLPKPQISLAHLNNCNSCKVLSQPCAGKTRVVCWTLHKRTHAETQGGLWLLLQDFICLKLFFKRWQGWSWGLHTLPKVGQTFHLQIAKQKNAFTSRSWSILLKSI